MARVKESVVVIDGSPHLKLTRGRSAALQEACRIALDSDRLDKRQKGTIGSLLDLFREAADGHYIAPDPVCYVYVHYLASKPDICKIGHTRNLVQRLSRNTDATERLKRASAWRFASVEEAMKREELARSLFEPIDGGGTEWVNAPAQEAVARLTKIWGPPIEE